MQFGVGILGKNYDFEANRAHILADDRPPGPQFRANAHKYAAKLAAETILAEPPTAADLSRGALLCRFAACARPVYPSEVAMVREAFLRAYGPDQAALDFGEPA